MASRFATDSATQFLFGHDVCTLAAGLPYPASSSLADSSEFLNHSSNKLVDAFTVGQLLSALRARRGAIWPLMEFWEDKVKPHRTIINEFIEPVLAEALARRAAVGSKRYAERENADDDREPMIMHLLNHIQGFLCCFGLVSSRLMPLYYQMPKY
jgi:hypothetical protein